MKGYKAFNKDLTCIDIQYEVGKIYEIKESPICCERGFHFCRNLVDVYKFYDMSDDTRICEVSALGEIVTNDNEKYCTNKIKIIREIKSKSIKHCNVDKTDVGYCNSGNYNSGDYNSGDYNSGNYNSGDYNSGDYNSGYCNSGNYNSGYRNSGNYNSGYRNSGYCNSGNYNSGNYNSGIFNTDKTPTIKMFDKESTWTFEDWINSIAREILYECPYDYSDFIFTEYMTAEEKVEHPEYKTLGGYTKKYIVTNEDRQKWWDSLSSEDKQICYDLPNFDADKFIECLGIDHI